jgi:hypothetical protein
MLSSSGTISYSPCPNNQYSLDHGSKQGDGSVRDIRCLECPYGATCVQGGAKVQVKSCRILLHPWSQCRQLRHRRRRCQERPDVRGQSRPCSAALRWLPSASQPGNQFPQLRPRQQMYYKCCSSLRSLTAAILEHTVREGALPGEVSTAAPVAAVATREDPPFNKTNCA